jgi:hypothetical protein
MRTVRDELAIELDPALDRPDPHPVDDFIDPDLRRHEPSWAEMDLPADLVEIAEGMWSELVVLADADPDGEASREALDALGERYADVVRRSQAIAYDTMVAFARVRVQVKVMEIAPDAEAAAPIAAGPEPEAPPAVDGTAAAARPTQSATRIARRRMRRAFRRWVKRPLVRTA